MEKVAGIGGLFFRAHDPNALANWYQQHLGIDLTPVMATRIMLRFTRRVECKI